MAVPLGQMKNGTVLRYSAYSAWVESSRSSTRHTRMYMNRRIGAKTATRIVGHPMSQPRTTRMNPKYWGWRETE